MPISRPAVPAGVPVVGAPDPDRRTSPIYDWESTEGPSADFELELGACYFNDVRFDIGRYVRSGDELLRCEQRGVWVRVGEVEP